MIRVIEDEPVSSYGGGTDFGFIRDGRIGCRPVATAKSGIPTLADSIVIVGNRRRIWFTSWQLGLMFAVGLGRLPEDGNECSPTARSDDSQLS